MNAFVDQHRQHHGVEPLCKALQIACSGYRKHAARKRDSALLPARAKRNAELMPQVQQTWDAHRWIFQPLPGASIPYKPRTFEVPEVSQCFRDGLNTPQRRQRRQR